MSNCAIETTRLSLPTGSRYTFAVCPAWQWCASLLMEVDEASFPSGEDTQELHEKPCVRLMGSTIRRSGDIANLTNQSRCRTCRKRKVRCSKQEPCSNCERAKIECLYDEASRNSKKPSTAAALADRVAELETLVVDLRQKLLKEGHASSQARLADFAGLSGDVFAAERFAKQISKETPEPPYHRDESARGRLISDNESSRHVMSSFGHQCTMRCASQPKT